MTDVLDILNTLIHDDHRWLGRVGRRERFEKGAVLIREGEPNDTLFFILSGVVAIHVAGVGEIARAANAGSRWRDIAAGRRPPCCDRDRNGTDECAQDRTSETSGKVGRRRGVCKSILSRRGAAPVAPIAAHNRCAQDAPALSDLDDR